MYVCMYVPVYLYLHILHYKQEPKVYYDMCPACKHEIQLTSTLLYTLCVCVCVCVHVIEHVEPGMESRECFN